MVFSSPAAGARRGSRKLTLENLERRELLASDLTESLMPADAPQQPIESSTIDPALESSRDDERDTQRDTVTALLQAVDQIVAQLAERA